MRFAFVTTEFPTTAPTSGGLSSYVARMSRLLAEAGHEVEIFVPSRDDPGSFTYRGCLVHHVPTVPGLAARLLDGILRNIGFSHIAMKRQFLAEAQHIAAAVERAHAAAAFDVVQSADYRAIGARIARRPGRLSVVRCSTAMDLYMACDGRSDRAAQIQIALEEAAIKRADLVIAPSAFTARHYRAKLGREIAVLPSPAYLEIAPAPAPSWLPQRYLLHFAGHLMRRKGTELIAEALKTALAEAPDLVMIWVGRMDFGAMHDLLAPLGDRAGQVIALYPQGKRELYALIGGATGVVLPSLVDNLPNTVIESLMLGVPVIGSRNSSIEELVEHGVDGYLIENGSVTALAEAMLSAWRGTLPLQPGRSWITSDLARPLQPEQVLQAYLGIIARAESPDPAQGPAQDPAQGQPNGTQPNGTTT
jgi:glycosyltransferase involved in cell wall biosynthesis